MKFNLTDINQEKSDSKVVTMKENAGYATSNFTTKVIFNIIKMECYFLLQVIDY